MQTRQPKPLQRRQPQRSQPLQRRAPSSLRNQIKQDAAALQAELDRLEVNASISQKRCNPGGDQIAFYGLNLHGKTTAAKVEGIIKELERAISRSRRKRTHLRFDDMMLRLEAEHPNKKPLYWSRELLKSIPPDTMIAGVSHHDGEQDVTVTFETPHILLAGETGSGKSVLLRNLITSLAYGTSPDDLRMVLIDLKNEDLLPYKTLPHVDTFAGTRDVAVKVIKSIVAEKDARIADPNRKPFRIVLVVDELAQLVPISDALKDLGDIMSIGRGKLINVIAATQQPTEDGGMGGMMKANVPLRLVGAVSNGQSYTATRRKNAQADMLPGNGSFLYISGPDMYRFQSYLLDEDGESEAIQMIRQRWGTRRSTTTTTIQTDTAFTRVIEPVEAVVEEKVVEAERDEIDDIAEQIRDLVGDGASKNAMCKAVFGRPYAGSYAGKIDAAIVRVNDSNKIIKMRKAS